MKTTFVSKLIDADKLRGETAQKQVIQEAVTLLKSALPGNARITASSSSVDVYLEIVGGQVDTTGRDYKSKSSRIVTRRNYLNYDSIKEAGIELSKQIGPSIRKVVNTLKKKYEFDQATIHRDIYEKANPPSLEYNVVLWIAE